MLSGHTGQLTASATRAMKLTVRADRSGMINRLYMVKSVCAVAGVVSYGSDNLLYYKPLHACARLGPMFPAVYSEIK